LAHWAGVMRQRGESGQSIRSWCRENGVFEKTYYYWQRKLRAAACERMAAPQFAEVSVQEAALPALPVAPVAPEPAMSSQLCIEVAGVRITADSAYPPDQLATLLRELTRSC